MLGFLLSISSFTVFYILQSYEIQHYCYSGSRMCLAFEKVSLDLCWTLYLAVLTASLLESVFSC